MSNRRSSWRPGFAAFAVVLAAMLSTTGCAQFRTTTGGSTTSASGVGSAVPTGPDGMRSGVFPTTRVEPPTDADRPDGPQPKPDAELTQAELTALIRLPASARKAAGRCSPDDLRLGLESFDAAAGHRYARLMATNTSDHACSLLGYPGLGFRGEWGTAFPVVAEQNAVPGNLVGVPTGDPDKAVTVEPGHRAAAEFEWTGALAGNRDESVSLIAVQFAAGGPAAALIVDPADHVDLGQDTTVRIGPWGPAECSDVGAADLCSS